MECANVGSIIVTIALQMHASVVDVNLSAPLKKIFENVRLFSKASELNAVPSGYISESRILYKVNEMFQQDLTSGSLDVLKRYVEYSHPKQKAYLKYWYSDITTEEERETACRLYDNITIDKVLTTGGAQSNATFLGKLCFMAEFQGIYVVSVHEKRSDANYKLIYPRAEEVGTNMNLLNVQDFQKFADMFGGELPDLNANSEILNIEENKARKIATENDPSLTENEKTRLISQENEQIFEAIKSWNIQMENSRTIESIKLSSLVKLIKNIVGPQCKLNILDYSCSEVSEHVLAKDVNKRSEFRPSYAVTSKENGTNDVDNDNNFEISINNSSGAANQNWGGRKRMKRSKRSFVKKTTTVKKNRATVKTVNRNYSKRKKRVQKK